MRDDENSQEGRRSGRDQSRTRRRDNRSDKPLRNKRAARAHGSRGRGRRRAPRGDVRSAVLVLLSEEPMHGYQLMHAIADRTDGRWQPSPGAIYPTISQLEDEGLITVTSSSGRKLAALTDAGRAHLAGNTAAPDPFASFDSSEQYVDLRGQLDKLHAVVRLVGQTGTDAQRAAAEGIITEARRAMYRLLADDVDTDRD